VIHQELSRPSLLKGEGAARAGVSALRLSRPAEAFPELGIRSSRGSTSRHQIRELTCCRARVPQRCSPLLRAAATRHAPPSRVAPWQAEVVSPSRSSTSGARARAVRVSHPNSENPRL